MTLSFQLPFTIYQFSFMEIVPQLANVKCEMINTAPKGDV